jgi:hypothetical protein
MLRSKEENMSISSVLLSTQRPESVMTSPWLFLRTKSIFEQSSHCPELTYAQRQKEENISRVRSHLRDSQAETGMRNIHVSLDIQESEKEDHIRAKRRPKQVYTEAKRKENIHGI